MYLNILKKDLKRKKTMNVILLIFIILATVLIASSVRNMTIIMTAMDNYIKKADVSDYEVMLTNNEERMEQFVKECEYINSYKSSKNPMLSKETIKLNGQKIDYTNTILVTSSKNSTVNFFDCNNEQIKDISNGEIYLTAEGLKAFGAEIGDEITIFHEEFSMNFTVKGIFKDIVSGSPIAGMTRLLVSNEEFNILSEKSNLPLASSYSFKINNLKKFESSLNKSGVIMALQATEKAIRQMYILDMALAAVLLLVSLCLIIISLILLKYTISFTINEEFREIGVMKAIGISTWKIRMIYILKYCAISTLGGIIGILLSVPFANIMLKQTSKNIVLNSDGYIIINVLCSVFVVCLVMYQSFRATAKIKKMKPIEAIRNGGTGERFKGKGFITMRRLTLRPICFMAVNDITSKWKQFCIMILTFMVGILLIIMPVNTINTLTSDGLVVWFSMKESDICMSKEMLFTGDTTKDAIEKELDKIKSELRDKGMEVKVYQEILFQMSLSHGENDCSSLSFQGIGDITARDYTYLSGTAPRETNEVAITHMIADKLDADIGDTITIHKGDEEKQYLVTAIYQSMSNNGECIRFHEDEILPFETAAGCFAVQVEFTDSPDAEMIKERVDIMADLFQEYNVQTCGNYIADMMGNVSDQIVSMKSLVMIIVILINVMVAILIEKTLLTKERGEIGMLKAIGFGNRSIIVWQTLRMGIALFIGTIIGLALSTPFSQVTSGQVFRFMGAMNIKFTVNIFEVYICYPALVLVATILATCVTAFGIKKISASEISNIE